MDNQDLLELAKRYFIAADGRGNTNLIRKIQVAERHRDCFATGRPNCDEMGCRWRAECLAEATRPAHANALLANALNQEGD